MSLTTTQWQESIGDTIRLAINDTSHVRIFAGCSKYGTNNLHDSKLTELNLSSCCGLVDYEPSELYISLLAGTPLKQIKQLLAENNQEFSFDPPMLKAASIGGAVATGVTGSSMPYRGALRHSILAVRMVNGYGHALSFGAPVIKNVAGFDLAKLMSGSFGMLGPIVELSLRVVAIPESRITLMFDQDISQAITAMTTIDRQVTVVEAQAWYAGKHYVRLAGTDQIVRTTAKQLGGEKVRRPDKLWADLVNQSLPEFNSDNIILRHSCVRNLPLAIFADMTPFAIDWGGSLRWYSINRNDYLHYLNRGILHRIGEGHGHIWRHMKPSMFLHNLVPMPQQQYDLHTRIRSAFDPYSLFNPDLDWYTEGVS